MDFHSRISRLADQVIRRLRLGAIDFTDVTPEELRKLVALVTSDVSSMKDDEVAYGSYAIDALRDGSDVKNLRQALWLEYRKRLLAWFTYAIQSRASVGGGGTGLKRLKDGVAAYIEDLPTQLVRGYKPMSAYIRGNITDVVDDAKLDAASVKVYKTLLSEATGSGLKMARGDLSVVWDAPHKVWFIPPTPATFPLKDNLSRSGFRWNPDLHRWESPRLTPAMKRWVTPETPGQPTLTKATVEDVSNWFFGTWLPKNIHRFATVFNAYIKSDETSYKFEFKVQGRGVTVEVDRDLKGPRDAVEELRYRYLGRQGRGPWLEVLDRYIDLTKTTNVNDVVLLIDRMNNLQHSNGLFMEHFPSSVKSWYKSFLDRKYSARDAYTLAGFIHDSDLRDIIRYYDQPSTPTFRDHGQGAPAIPIEEKKHQPGINWRERGYPREKGYKQPSRQSPEVQRGLSGLPGTWDT